MGNNVVVPDRQPFDGMDYVRLDATVQTILQQSNVSFKDNVATVSDLPTTGNVVDDFRLVLQDGWVYKWTGTQWEQPGTFDGIYSVDVTLTPTQILNLWQTPIEIVPAPGVNKIIQPVTSIVEYSRVVGGTTDYSPVSGSIYAFFDYDFGFNPSFSQSYSGKNIVSELAFATQSQRLTMTPTQNLSGAMNIGYISNPVNKGINIWEIFDVNNPYNPPTVGDRNITFRFNYRILDLGFTPYIPHITSAFTLKTACSGGAFTPFDGTETDRAVTRLYTSSSYSILPDLVLNPVYEGAGVWNLGDGIISQVPLQNQGYWAVDISCVKGGQTIHFETRGGFPSIVGSVATLNGTYIL